MLFKQIMNGESKTLEFKETLPKGNQIAKTAVAFSNYAGGKIVIGITDKREIIGIDSNCDIFKIKESLESQLIDSCSPLINFDIYTENINDKLLIVIEIFPGKMKPYYLKKYGRENGVFLRIGSSNRKANNDNILELERQRANISYDEEIDYNLDFKNLNLDPLKLKFSEVGKELSFEKMINLGLIIQDGTQIRCTKGLGIILGKYENCEIKCARFKGIDMTYFIDKKEFNSDIFNNIKDIESFLKNHLNLRSEFEGFQRRDILEIPPLALREAIVNAVVHRDYSNLGRDIKIAIYDHVVEIVSPGCLPNTLTIEEIYFGRSEIRNKVLARIFKELDYIEKWGSGLKRINTLCTESGIEAPTVKETGDSVSIIFKRTDKKTTGKAPDNHRITTGKVPDNHRITTGKVSLSEIEKSVFDLIHDKITRKEIQNSLNISEGRVREILRTLQEKNFIEKLGSGRNTYYLNKNMDKISTGKAPDNHRITTGKVSLSEIEKSVFDLIHDKITRKEIQNSLNISEGRVREILRTLQEKNFIEKLGSGRNTYYLKIIG